MAHLNSKLIISFFMLVCSQLYTYAADYYTWSSNKTHIYSDTPPTATNSDYKTITEQDLVLYDLTDNNNNEITPPDEPADPENKTQDITNDSAQPANNALRNENCLNAENNFKLITEATKIANKKALLEHYQLEINQYCE